MNRDYTLVAKLAALAACTFGFGYLLIPIYDVFCDITGINGKTENAAATVVEQPDLERSIEVEFIGSLNQGAPWEFRPAVARMTVHPGKLYDTTFFARNLTDDVLVGQAVPSVSPGQAARHFQKTDCFCFTEQRFEQGEGRDMAVRFIIDPDLPAHVETVTLGYTFFATDRLAAAP